MSFENEFLEMMPDVVQVRTSSTTNEFGEKGGWSTRVADLRCRIVYKTRIVRRVAGQELVSEITVYCAGNNNITTEEELLLPDATQQAILDVGRFGDSDGAHHEEVLLGWKGKGGAQ